MEFFQLGFDPVLEISAEHGTGVAELLDEIVERLGAGLRARERRRRRGSGLGRRAADDGEPPAPSPTASDDETRVAIVGRPNVGKSSLVNRLLREERVLVSDMPGTTRDAIDSPLMWHRRQLPDHRHGRHAAAGPRRRAAARWRWSASRSPRKRSPTPTSSRSSSTRAPARPIRTRRSAAKPTAPDAASSSSPTNGTS